MLRSKTGVRLSDVYRLDYDGGRDPHQVAAALGKRPGVIYAEPHFVHHIALEPTDRLWNWQRRYLHEPMHFTQAWDVARAEEGDVIVAIVDGGTDWNHPDLRANIWTNPAEVAGNGVDDDGNGFADDVHGWNFALSTNDPTAPASVPLSGEHGTHVAGIVGAVTNDGFGGAGAAWNPRVMPVCAALDGQDGIIGYGLEGIAYAAAMGADIINCSWGALRPQSRFEQEVITSAWEQGAVIVAAAGNDNTWRNFIPASYDHVLSVTSVGDNGRLMGIRGLRVDVSAIGSNIWSTLPNGNWGYLSGSSMAAPLASAACVLVKTHWPQYGPDQVIERVRATAKNVDGLQELPWYVGTIGRGRIDAYQAMVQVTPSIRITGVRVVDQDGDGLLEPGETADLTLRVTNYLDRATSVSFVLRENQSFVKWSLPQGYPSDVAIVRGVATLAAMDPMETVELPDFNLRVDPETEPNYQFFAVLEILASSPSYSDLDYFTLIVQPSFVTHDLNNLGVTVTATGALGHALTLGGSGDDGIGVRFCSSNDLLFAGSLLVGTSAAQVSDAAPGIIAVATDQDFVPTADGLPHFVSPRAPAHQQSLAQFDDSGAAGPLGVLITQRGYQFAESPDDDYLILSDVVRNTMDTPILGLRVGWYCDWAIDRTTWLTNRTGFDAERQLGYVWDEQGAVNGTYMGIRVLTDPGATSCRGIYVDPLHPGSNGWGILDGFSSLEKWEALSGGIVSPAIGPADVAQVIATGPFDLAAGEDITVAFAFVAGESLADLQANADAARARWDSGLPTPVSQFLELSAVASGDGVLVQWQLLPEDIARLRGLAVQRAARAWGPYMDRNGMTLLVPAASMTYEDRAPDRRDSWYRLRLVGIDGSQWFSAPVQVAAATFRTALSPVFTSSGPAKIRYSLGSPVERVILELFDVRGHSVVRLDQGRQVPGDYVATWDRHDSIGRHVASGIYFLRMTAAEDRLTTKVVLMH